MAAPLVVARVLSNEGRIALDSRRPLPLSSRRPAADLQPSPMPDQPQPAEQMRPFDARMLDVGDGHWIYVEEVGRPDGTPALFLHGGPGSGSQHLHRRLFDPEIFHAFLFDQRGAGRSHPYLSLAANTTDHLVADIERIREHFGIEKWLVVGGSWGSTLALAYAERFPHRVTGLVLRAIFLGSTAEVQWAFVQGPKIFRPDLYADWISFLPDAERADPLHAYLAHLASADAAIQGPAARLWHDYERALSELAPSQPRLSLPVSGTGRLPPTPIIEAHYIRNDFFLKPDELLRGAKRLAGIPGAIIQGRYDLLCPPKSAEAIAEAWPGCRLTLMEKAGHAMTEAGVMEAMYEAARTLAQR
jgi:proline iminopeptidase